MGRGPPSSLPALAAGPGWGPVAHRPLPIAEAALVASLLRCASHQPFAQSYLDGQHTGSAHPSDGWAAWTSPRTEQGSAWRWSTQWCPSGFPSPHCVRTLGTPSRRWPLCSAWSALVLGDRSVTSVLSLNTQSCGDQAACRPELCAPARAGGRPCLPWWSSPSLASLEQL